MSEKGWGDGTILPDQTVLKVACRFKAKLKMKTFFVGVTSCGYGAYSVVAESPEEAEKMVREKHYPDWGEKPGLEVKVVQINTSWGVHELDELNVVA